MPNTSELIRQAADDARTAGKSQGASDERNRIVELLVSRAASRRAYLTDYAVNVRQHDVEKAGIDAVLDALAAITGRSWGEEVDRRVALNARNRRLTGLES